MPRQKLLFLCKDACNCDLGRANIDRLFYKWNHTSIPELSGYSSRGMASFSFWTNLVQNGHISGLLHSLLQWKKEKLRQWVRGWGGKGEGAPARRQADFWLYLLVCFFFLAYQPQKRKNITTAPTKESRRSFRSATGRLQAALPGKWGHDRSYLRRRWGLPSRASGAPILTRPIYIRGKWPIYLWDLCHVLTCGILSNAKMGYSMDRKEVKSCNFTVKICVSRQKYVQEGMRLSAVWWTTLRTI